MIAFDADDKLMTIMTEAASKGVDPGSLTNVVCEAIDDGTVTAPWGVKFFGSKALENLGGEWWLVSCERARTNELIEADELSFTIDDIRVLLDATRTLGATVSEVRAEYVGTEKKLTGIIRRHGLNLTVPLVALAEVYDTSYEEFNVCGRVQCVNEKDHNDKDKVALRGYKMRGATLYGTINVIDDSGGTVWLIADKNYYRAKSEELQGIPRDTLCLFKVHKQGKFITVKKHRVLE